MAYKLGNENLKKELEKIGKQSVIFITNELLNSKKYATYDLIKSLDFKVITFLNDLMLEITSEDYFKYVDEGRKPFSKQPPISSIMNWMKTKKIQGRDEKGRFIPRKTSAFLIARSIGINGIKPLNIKKKLINNILLNRSEAIKKGVSEDVQHYINILYNWEK